MLKYEIYDLKNLTNYIIEEDGLNNSPNEKTKGDKKD